MTYHTVLASLTYHTIFACLWSNGCRLISACCHHACPIQAFLSLHDQLMVTRYTHNQISSCQWHWLSLQKTKFLHWSWKFIIFPGPSKFMCTALKQSTKHIWNIRIECNLQRLRWSDMIYLPNYTVTHMLSWLQITLQLASFSFAKSY